MPAVNLTTADAYLRYARAFACVPALFTWGPQHAAGVFDAAGSLKPDMAILFRACARGSQDSEWHVPAVQRLMAYRRQLWPQAARPLLVMGPCYGALGCQFHEEYNVQPLLIVARPPAPAMPFLFYRSPALFALGPKLLDPTRAEMAADLPWMLAAWVCGSSRLDPVQARQTLDACALPPAEMQPLLVQMLESPEPLARQYAAHILARCTKLDVSRDANSLPDDAGVVQVKARFDTRPMMQDTKQKDAPSR